MISDEDREEYGRRVAVWERVREAAMSAAVKELGEVQGAKIEALAKGNGRGFFETLLAWVAEPVLGQGS